MIPNQTCLTAITITSLPFDVIIDTTTAGNSPGSDNNCASGNGYNSVWYKWIAPSGLIAIKCKITDSSFDISCSVFRGTCGSLIDVDCGSSSGQNIPVTAGETYFFLLTSYHLGGSIDSHLIITETVPTGDFCKALIASLPELSGVYFINPAKTHDIYNGPTHVKIPNPTIKTALLGE